MGDSLRLGPEAPGQSDFDMVQQRCERIARGAERAQSLGR